MCLWRNSLDSKDSMFAYQDTTVEEGVLEVILEYREEMGKPQLRSGEKGWEFCFRDSSGYQIEGITVNSLSNEQWKEWLWEQTAEILVNSTPQMSSGKIVYLFVEGSMQTNEVRFDESGGWLETKIALWKY